RERDGIAAVAPLPPRSDEAERSGDASASRPRRRAAGTAPGEGRPARGTPTGAARAAGTATAVEAARGMTPREARASGPLFLPDYAPAMTEPRGVVLVEGRSDQLALEALAVQRGIDLGRECVVIQPIGGAHAIRRFADRFPGAR